MSIITYGNLSKLFKIFVWHDMSSAVMSTGVCLIELFLLSVQWIALALMLSNYWQKRNNLSACGK